jgi:hypothetical protein
MFKRKPKPGTLLAHVLVTLAYPAARALTEPQNRLLLFTDAMTIIAIVLLVCGIVYALILRGDFDISGFAFLRGLRGGGKNYDAYKADRQKEREEAFNYPLFLGILYLLAAAVIAWGFY